MISFKHIKEGDMKKSFYFVLCVILLSATVCGALFQIPSAAAEEQKSLFSSTRAPIFYGATKITIDKNVTDNFDIFDSRFRIFAKDFEDGDLTTKISCTFNNVQSSIPGNYEIRYSVSDSSNNQTTISVPVTVLDQENGECTIERTLYTLPSTWNLADVKILRCHAGDKQNLGIYMPSESSVSIKVISADKDIKLSFWGNDSAKESQTYLKTTNSDYVEFTNVRNSISYDCVPFALSVQQEKGEDVNKTYKIEIKFDSSVKKLDYFFDGDSEEKYLNSWRESKNTFSVVDSGSVTVIVPYLDIDKLPNGEPNGNRFLTIQTFVDFYKVAIDRMSAMIGLSINPSKTTDQDIHSKYFFKANLSQKYVLAYYANDSDYIGIASTESVSAFFYYGWGTLHEIAHGYQGYFGRGVGGGDNIGLQETGNNILAYYIQSDKSLYIPNDNWIGGSLENIESSRNKLRQEGVEVFYSGGTNIVVDRLYAILNLLNAFEGSTTYAKMFSYYRELMLTQKETNLTVPEIYAKFFAKEYGANIIPYLDAWKLKLGDNTRREIMQEELVPFSIFKDSVSENSFNTIKENEDLSLKYGVVSEKLLRKYSLKSNLTLSIEIDDFNIIAGKKVGLFKDGKKILDQTIQNKTLTFSNLEIGTYEIRLPINFNYDCNYLMVSLREGDNNFTYSYSKNLIKDYSYHPSKIVILGRHKFSGSIGCGIELSSNTSATITYGGADLCNRVEPWTTTRKDETFILVQIFDCDGNTVFGREVKGNEYFSTKNETLPKIPVLPGYKVKIFSQRPDLVKVVSTENNVELTSYNSNMSTLLYEITKDGFKFLNQENFNEKEVLYQNAKSLLLKKITDYQAKVTKEEIENKRINPKQKIDVICAFNALNEADQEPYVDFINSLKRGGVPTLTLQNFGPIKQNTNLDLYSLVSAFDNEDGALELENITISPKFNNSKIGKQTLTIFATDSDGNVSSKEITIEVMKNNNSTLILFGSIFGACAVTIIIAVLVVKIKKRKRRIN